ncbi:PaaI family thioesterase [Nocardia sp. alder85J]|uniref:PaaI family thioesterase n=1 Tax=Nocardia sp. alder85J TaxID=2862949 RepID=UPI003A4E2918
MLDGTLGAGDSCRFAAPTAIARTLGFRLVEVGPGTAAMEVDADADRHGNQQGTVHGGLITELADAAIGTAHSTLVAAGESFTSVELRVVFLRPVWRETLRATARAVEHGRTLTHWECVVTRADGKAVARVSSVVTTLRGQRSAGR